jgi:hydrogen peroxide-dependent heme synthase
VSELQSPKNTAPQTLDGWYTLHDFRTFDFAQWKKLPTEQKQSIYEELVALLTQYEEMDAARAGSYGLFSIVGHKADFLFMHMRPTVKELIDVKMKFQRSSFADYTSAPYSYFSVVELGSYLAKEGVDIETDAYLQSRLKPELPNMPHICFYPMNKKRNGTDNWYTLPPQERGAYLREHGMIGRTYAGKVKQIISGSVGFDDWEWGVTLFADDALQFKKLVYEMRFEEGSARFGDFGPFLIGHRLEKAELRALLGLA